MSAGEVGNFRPWIGSLLIALVVLVAYWPLTTFEYSLSNGDTMDCWLPWRHFIAASLKEGHLPSWEPLQQMGYPIHADLQGPAWYPEALILGGTVGMGPHILQLLFLLYLIIGSWGVRSFTSVLVGHHPSAVIAGVSYALSGFFTAHAMHFYAVISAAWLPWFFWALLKLMDAPGWRNSLIAAIFLFLLLTGGNHTFLIIAGYPIAALFFWKITTLVRRGALEQVRSLIGFGLLSIGVAAVMACGTLHAVWEVSAFIDRDEGLALDQAGLGAFTFNGLRSLIWPAAATASAVVLGTDPTMANGYFGAIALIIGMIGLRHLKDPRLMILTAFALVFALASFGDRLIVHELLWRTLPGMDLFRFPGYFWYFVMLFLLPIVALGIQRILYGDHKSLLISLASLLIVISIVVMVRNEWTGSLDTTLPFRILMGASGTGTLMIANATVLIIILMVLILITWTKKLNWPWLMLLVTIEMIAGIQFTQWHTTIGPNPPSELADRIASLPQGPVLPIMRPMRMNRDGSEVLHLLWRNTQVFQGQPTYDGFNSFRLTAFDRLVDHHSQLHHHMLDQPLVFFSDHVTQRGSEPVVARASDDQNGLLPIGFTYNSVELKADLRSDRFLVVQQGRYPGWRILADGADRPVVAANVAAFGAWIPAGTRSIGIIYHKPVLRVLSLISFLVFFSVLLMLALTSVQKHLWSLSVVILIIAWSWSMFAHVPKDERIAEGWDEAATLLHTASRAVIINSDRNLPLYHSDLRTVRMDLPDELYAMERSFKEFPAAPDTLVIGWYGLPINPASRAFLADLGYRIIDRKGNEDAGAVQLILDREHETEWPLLHHDPLAGGMNLSAQGDRWTAAWRKNIDELHEMGVKQLLITLDFSGKGSAGSSLVMERRWNNVITDHETIPLYPEDAADLDEHRFVAVRQVPHRRHSREELGIYVMAYGDTVKVKDLKVHSLPPLPTWP